MDPNLVSQFLKVTESAAIASFAWVGKGDRHAADDAATQAMRTAFNAIDFDGTVVIGEGERDEAPMLFIGEKLGTGKGPKTDIAVDPLEGTNLCAKGEPNSICVLAAGPDRSLFHAPDTYMDKIAVGAKVGNAVSLSKSVEENLDAVWNYDALSDQWYVFRPDEIGSNNLASMATSMFVFMERPSSTIFLPKDSANFTT